MDTPFAILRFSKLKTLGNVAASASHTFRERETPNADAGRTPLNLTEGARGSEAVVAAVKGRVALAKEVSANPVLCIEALCTASPEWWKLASAGQKREFFKRSAAWLRGLFGEKNVVSMTVHLDETSPHLAAYIVPLVKVDAKTRFRNVVVGKNEDGTKLRQTREFSEPSTVRLSAAHWLNGRARLCALQTDFARRVADLGLRRGVLGSRATHTRVSQYYARVNQPFAPLPKLLTPAPKRLRPEPQKPRLLSSRAERLKWESDHASWEQERDAVVEQMWAHGVEVHAQQSAAVSIARQYEAQAREASTIRSKLAFWMEEAHKWQSHSLELERLRQLFSAEEINARSEATNRQSLVGEVKAELNLRRAADSPWTSEYKMRYPSRTVRKPGL